MANFKPRLLPALMGLGAVAFLMQASQFANGIFEITGPAVAQDHGNNTQDATVPPNGGAEGQNGNVIIEQQAQDGFIDPALMSRSEVELLRDLSKRRVDLDNREQQIATRERLLEATEKRIEVKIADLKQLEAQIAQLIGQHETNQNQQVDNLVRIYEKMKAKDAARIFQGLALDIQVSVAQRMKNDKIALILAEMESSAAKTLSTRLAQKVELPTLNSDG